MGHHRGKFVTKGTSISPRQLWARRRNWEKRQLEYFHRELGFRLEVRWGEGENRSQTQTDDEIKDLRKVISLLHGLLENWNRNTGTRRTQINFKQYK
jgi:hypothetical protein